MLEIKTENTSFTLKKVEWYETKQGTQCLKCKGSLNKSVYLDDEASRTMPMKNYFGKILLFGEKDYLDYVCETLWKPENENGIKLKVKECYCELPYFNGKVFSSLYIVDSDLDKKKFYKTKREKENLFKKYKLKIPKEYKEQ